MSLLDLVSILYQGIKVCKQLRSKDFFAILDTAISSYQLKIMEALHISWLKPGLNSQLTHCTLTLSL